MIVQVGWKSWNEAETRLRRASVAVEVMVSRKGQFVPETQKFKQPRPLNAGIRMLSPYRFVHLLCLRT